MKLLSGISLNQTLRWDYLFVPSDKLERRVEHPDYLEIMQPVPTSPGGVWKGTLAEVLNDLAPEIDP